MVTSYQFRGGRWRGVDKQQVAGVMDRSFVRLENCYVSQDGQQIRRWPGWRCIADLTTLNSWRAGRSASYRVNGGTTHAHVVESEMVRIWAFEQVRGRLVMIGEADHARQKIASVGPVELFTVSVAAGNPGSVTMSGTPLGPRESLGIGIHAPGAGYQTGDAIYFENTGSVELDGRFFRVTNVVGAVITLNAVIATGNALSANGRAYRVRQNNNPAAAYTFATKSVLDPDCLAIWTMRVKPTPGSPETTCTPAVSFDRRPDYGSDPLAPWPYMEGFRGVSRRRPRTMPVRPAIDVGSDRILLASPRSPCIWQIPVIMPVGIGVLSPDLTNDVHDAPRSLGVPKGLLFDPGTKDVGHGLLYASGILTDGLPVGTYTFQVMYRDDATGEIGLPSEPVRYAITEQQRNINLYVPNPGYYYPESGALTVMVLATPTNGPETGLHKLSRLSSYGAPPILAAVGSTISPGDILGFYESIQISVPAAMGRQWSRQDISFDFDPGTLRQMPMGANAVRTVRAFTFFGGHSGSDGEAKQIDRGTVSAGFTEPEYDTGVFISNRSWRGQEVAIRGTGVDGLSLDGDFRLQAGCMIYPAYAGQKMVLIDNALPNNERSITLNRCINPYSVTTTNALYGFPDMVAQRWSLVERVFQRGWGPVYAQRVAMVMPSGFYQYSEPDNPGAVPNTANGYIDAGQDDDIIGIGRGPSVTIFCTRSQTFALYWERSPNGRSPILLSTEHGCIAPNSMIDFQGGCAWVSDRGPVVYRVGGGVEWIGQRIAQDFVGSNPRYVRDLGGLMHLCWGAHDAERGLLMWGVRANRQAFTIKGPDGVNYTWETASPELRTKFPADEVIVYNYRSDALSHWVPPTGMQVFWMRPVECADNVTRMSFLAQDGRIYAMDDAWHDGSSLGGFAVANADATSSTSFVAVNNSFNVGGNLLWSNESYCRVGQEFAIYDPRTRELRANGTITAVNSQSQVTLSKACTWRAGDAFVWGFQTMTMETRQESWANAADAKGLRRLDVRYESVALSALTGSGAADRSGLAWLDAFARDTRGTEVFWREPVVDTANRLVGERAVALEPSGTRVVPRVAHFVAANNAVSDNLSVGVSIIGPAQCRVVDVEVVVDEVP